MRFRLRRTGCTDYEGTAQQSRRIRVYPTLLQKLALRTWLDASRWAYNLTVEILQYGIPPNWYHIAEMVMAEITELHPEWRLVPYQVKRTAVRDACRAKRNAIKFNQQLKADHNQGLRLDTDFAELRFRSRKNPRQSCYIPDNAVSEYGVYHTNLGPLRMAETVPAGPKECRLVKERGQYFLVVPYPAQCDVETPCGDGVVALDPWTPAFAPFSRSSPKPTAAKSATWPSLASRDSAITWTTSSAAPQSKPTTGADDRCAEPRTGCVNASST